MADGPAGIRITNNYEKYEIVNTSDSFNPELTYYMGTYNWNGMKYTEIKLADETSFEAAKATGTTLYTTKGEIYYQYCTAFPVGTLLAQTWDEGIVMEVGSAVAEEMLEYGVTYWLAPGINIHRNPLCGRNFEYYSEDPVLTGFIALGMLGGVEAVVGNANATSGVGVTFKHFAFNQQENSRMGSNSVVSERAAREIYLEGFRIVSNTWKPAGQPYSAIMSSYNMINGIPTFENYGLLTEILRNEWGFEGFVMTDWYSVGSVYGYNSNKNVQA